MATDVARTNRFGPRVLGDDAFEAQIEAEKAESKGGVVFGSRVMESEEPELEEAPGSTTDSDPTNGRDEGGDGTEPPAEPVTEGDTPSDGQPTDSTTPDAAPTPPPPDNPFVGEELPTVDATKELLAARPELFNDAYSRECLLPAPRKGVLEELRRIELDRSEPRDQVTKVLDALLEK